jgi:hypothetical protein
MVSTISSPLAVRTMTSMHGKQIMGYSAVPEASPSPSSITSTICNEAPPHPNTTPILPYLPSGSPSHYIHLAEKLPFKIPSSTLSLDVESKGNSSNRIFVFTGCFKTRHLGYAELLMG